MDYYNLHELGYTLGELKDLTPLQIQYLALASKEESRKREEHLENYNSNIPKGGRRKLSTGTSNGSVKSKLKQKYKAKQQQRADR